MTKRQDLYLQRRSRSEQSDQHQPNQAKSISHEPRASPDSTSLASRIEFPTMTGTQSPVRRQTIFSHRWMKSRITAMARSGASGIAGNKETVRTEPGAEAAPHRCRGEPVSPYS